jgi:Tfp pilus assembly protein PilW
MRNINHLLRFSEKNSGFSLLEVLLGITVFMIGMLGVTALNISSLKSNTFSGNLSEATSVAASKLEELMAQDFDDAAFLYDVDYDGNRLDGCSAPYTNQDADNDGMDDDDPDDTATDVDGKPNFGLDDFGADADYGPDIVAKNNITYNVYWNVAENEPVTIDNDADPNNCPPYQDTKIVTVVVEWFIKDEPRRISMSTVLQRY